MRRFNVTNLVVVLLLLCANGCNLNSKPVAKSVEPVLQEYLVAQFAGQKDVRVKKLEGVRIGKYIPVFKGWTVFSEYAVEYKDNGIPITNHGRSNERTLILVRNVGGKVECFRPAALVEIESKMNEAFAGGMPDLDW